MECKALSEGFFPHSPSYLLRVAYGRDLKPKDHEDFVFCTHCQSKSVSREAKREKAKVEEVRIPDV